MSSKTVDSVTTSYTYDAIDQLLSESRSGYSASYTYDANGNRATRTVNGLLETYANDAGDKLTSVTWSGGSKTFGYDAAGRTTSIITASGTTSLAYDYESRVSSITYPNASVDTFTYNGLDTRVGKGGAQGSSTFKRNGVGVTAPVLSDGDATYTPGISERRGSATTYSHTGIKNAEVQTSSSQAVSATNQYDAFGNLASSTGTWNGPFAYGGPFGYQSDASGLKLLGHRYYDSSTGRFLTRDPVKDGRNWYGYCGNNPVRQADPSGLYVWDDPDNWFYNFMVGLGDGVSFGLTKLIREPIGLNEYVDEDNGWHLGGEIGGNVIGLYVGGAGLAKVWDGAVGGALRLGGNGTRASHLIRIESGNVHLISGQKWSAIRVLHFHVNALGLESLHLPYQLWYHFAVLKTLRWMVDWTREE
ncbi:MAG: RHS repeat-associated core domain-containing protein [Armatimonadetes bacterium]|nr:RHS repeat-associated core domain-containing protein [Armatimonadota bacterium]